MGFMLIIFLLAIPIAAFAGAKIAQRVRAPERNAEPAPQPDRPIPDNVSPFRKRA